MTAAAQTTAAEPVALQAADGYRISALCYPARGPVAGHLVVAGATGVQQRFYRRFAEYASAQGFNTLTLDYRGIGLSRPPSLKGFSMDYLDWARQDLAAAVQLMASGTQPLFMVGHSYGGHAFGLLPNHEQVARFYTFATGAGWHGWMPPLERVRVLAMWRVLGPLLTRWKGYLPWSLLGMGEDLPLDVYRQWRQWCQYPRYFFDDPAQAHLAEDFARVRTPIIAANALDDHWAPPRSRDAFMAAYRQAGWQAVDVDPRHAGLGPVGHMGYFRPAAQPLWDAALHWFRQHPHNPTHSPKGAPC
jgi:predicted alpha/beta hydrolase